MILSLRLQNDEITAQGLADLAVEADTYHLIPSFLALTLTGLPPGCLCLATSTSSRLDRRASLGSFCELSSLASSKLCWERHNLLSDTCIGHLSPCTQMVQFASRLSSFLESVSNSLPSQSSIVCPQLSSACSLHTRTSHSWTQSISDLSCKKDRAAPSRPLQASRQDELKTYKHDIMTILLLLLMLISILSALQMMRTREYTSAVQAFNRFHESEVCALMHVLKPDALC